MSAHPSIMRKVNIGPPIDTEKGEHRPTHYPWTFLVLIGPPIDYEHHIIVGPPIIYGYTTYFGPPIVYGYSSLPAHPSLTATLLSSADVSCLNVILSPSASPSCMDYVTGRGD